MNVINSSGSFRIFGDSVKTYSRLPVATYLVMFDPNQGYYLVQKSDMTITEDKIYGNNQEKVNKAMKSYAISNKNFGILLSGSKGIGKTLFLKMLAASAIKDGIPVIIVNDAYPNIAQFISSIEQDVVVVFDEFEKTFDNTNNGNGPSSQETLLPLFDGIDGGHKMFVVTCNDVDRISYFMLNRPGRFHYHFELKPPTLEEITEYLTDKLDPKYHDTIEKVANLAVVMSMPYDHLRALVFELNQGYSLKETLNDINIGYDSECRFDVTVRASDGKEWKAYSIYIDDMTSNKTVGIRVYACDKLVDDEREAIIRFIPSNIKLVDGILTATGPISIDNPWGEEPVKDLKVESMTFKRYIFTSRKDYDI